MFTNNILDVKKTEYNNIAILFPLKSARILQKKGSSEKSEEPLKHIR